MKYIDADKLIAEIDKKWRELADKNVKVGGGKYDIEISTHLSIKNLISSLQQEQPEVDLEKEINDYMYPIQAWEVQEAPFTSLAKCARHFYELGLNARKED